MAVHPDSWLEKFSDEHHVAEGEEGRLAFYLTKADRDLIAVLFEWPAEPHAFLRRELMRWLRRWMRN